MVKAIYTFSKLKSDRIETILWLRYGIIFRVKREFMKIGMLKVYPQGDIRSRLLASLFRLLALLCFYFSLYFFLKENKQIMRIIFDLATTPRRGQIAIEVCCLPQDDLDASVNGQIKHVTQFRRA